MNYFVRNSLDDFNRWFKRIVPFAMSELKQYGHGTSFMTFRNEYEDALRVKHQLYSIEILLDDRHLEYLEETIISNRPSAEPRPIERELRMDIFEVWRAVCFPKDKPQIKTVKPVMLGGLLRAERLKRNIPARHAAGLVGIAEKTLYHYEDGTRMLRVDVFYKLCQIYKADPNELLKEAAKVV